MDFPQIIKHKNIFLKLYNWMDYTKGEPAGNVEAFDENGKLLWVIESLGGNSDADCYTNISSTNRELHAFSFQCLDCIVDEKTGKIISSNFSK